MGWCRPHRDRARWLPWVLDQMPWKWFQPDEFASDRLKIIDINGDGKNELIEIGRKVRDGIDGKVIREMKGDDKSAILMVEGKDKKKSFLFCDFHENKLACKDESEKNTIESNAPLSEVKNDNIQTNNPYATNSERIYKPNAVWINLKKDKPKYLAIVGSFIGVPRSNFYLYDEKGALVYHELLPEDAETIAVLPNESGNESILVGGKDTIWKFSTK